VQAQVIFVINLVFLIVGLFFPIFSFRLVSACCKILRKRNQRERQAADQDFWATWTSSTWSVERELSTTSVCQRCWRGGGGALLLLFLWRTSRSHQSQASPTESHPLSPFWPCVDFCSSDEIKSMPSKCQCSWREVLKAEATWKIARKLSPEQACDKFAYAANLMESLPRSLHFFSGTANGSRKPEN